MIYANDLHFYERLLYKMTHFYERLWVSWLAAMRMIPTTDGHGHARNAGYKTSYSLRSRDLNYPN